MQINPIASVGIIPIGTLYTEPGNGSANPDAATANASMATALALAYNALVATQPVTIIFIFQDMLVDSSDLYTGVFQIIYTKNTTGG